MEYNSGRLPATLLQGKALDAKKGSLLCNITLNANPILLGEKRVVIPKWFEGSQQFVKLSNFLSSHVHQETSSNGIRAADDCFYVYWPEYQQSYSFVQTEGNFDAASQHLESSSHQPTAVEKVFIYLSFHN